MERSPLKPETIQGLSTAAYSASALLAGMQLDLFTPLKGGVLGGEQIAAAIGVNPARLNPLLYALRFSMRLWFPLSFREDSGLLSFKNVSKRPARV